MFDHEKSAAGWWETDEFGFLRESDIFENQQPIADAHNALAIQLETGWHAERSLDDLSAWFVLQTFVEMSRDGHEEIYHPTPVHAILAAWEWHKKREGPK